jgi:pimeloyl-ACP methyl ester carboxylesterase
MKTIVLLHGFGEDCTVWNPLKAALQPEYQVVTPDYSEADKFETMDEYADWLHTQLLLDEVVKCALIGHSMGGYIALAFAEKYPQMLTGLGVFHSTSYADTDERKVKRLEIIETIRQHGSGAFLKTFVPTMYADSFVEAHPEQIEAHLTAVADLSAGALVTAMEAMRTRPSRAEVLKKAAWPVLFIIGMRDKSIPAQDLIEQARWPAESYQLVLEEVGHMGMVEAPEACLAAIRQFLEKT